VRDEAGQAKARGALVPGEAVCTLERRVLTETER